MNEREEYCRGIGVWEVDQGGSRRGIGKVEGEDDSGRCWPGAVDMFQDGFTGRKSVLRCRYEIWEWGYGLVLIKDVKSLNGIA